MAAMESEVVNAIRQPIVETINVMAKNNCALVFKTYHPLNKGPFSARKDL
jgi:hypothetical protein